MSEVTVHALFPIPVCVFKYKSNTKLETFLKTQTIKSEFTHALTREHFSPIKKMYGTYSQNINVLRTPECVDLRKFILNSCKIFGNTVMGYDVPEYIDTISWVSIKSPGDEHIPHTHPNSFISGVYYFDANLQQCPIVFTDPSAPIVGKHNTLSVKQNPNSESTFASESVTLGVEQGELVLFPSYLKHMVEKNKTNSNRYSLAFNVVPRYSSGTDNELTLFNYGDAI